MDSPLTTIATVKFFHSFGKLAHLLAILGVALTAFGVPAPAQQLAYVVTSQQQFGVVNLSTGQFQQIGAPTPDGQANLVWGRDGSLLSLTISGNLESINPFTGATKVIGATGLGFNAFDLAEVDGQLFATDFQNNLYRVDSKTGFAKLIGPTGIPADPNIPFSTNSDGTINLCDESLYGVDDRLYATFDSFTIDPVTLNVTTVVSANLYEIDPLTGNATLVAPTLLNLGATVQDAARFYAFRWVPQAFTEFGPQIQSQIFSLDRNTGAATFMVSVDPSAGGITGAAPVRHFR